MKDKNAQLKQLLATSPIQPEALVAPVIASVQEESKLSKLDWLLPFVDNKEANSKDKGGNGNNKISY